MSIFPKMLFNRSFCLTVFRLFNTTLHNHLVKYGSSTMSLKRGSPPNLGPFSWCQYAWRAFFFLSSFSVFLRANLRATGGNHWGSLSEWIPIILLVTVNIEWNISTFFCYETGVFWLIWTKTCKKTFWYSISRRKGNINLFRQRLLLQRIKVTAIWVLNYHTPEDLYCKKCEIEETNKKTNKQ